MLDCELFDLLEGTTDAAFSVTRQGEILSWNKAAEELFGYTRGAALHKTCHEILEGIGPLGTRVHYRHCSVAGCAGGKIDIPNFDVSVKKRSGKRVWINMSTIVFDNQRTGRRLLIHLARDVTEHKQGEKLMHKILELSKQLSSLGEGSLHAEPISPLSEQERNVLRMFAKGKESAEIIDTLGISPQTLRNHLYHINRKLRTHNRLEAVMHAMQRKLI